MMKKKNKWLLSAAEAIDLSTPTVILLLEIDFAIKTACKNGAKTTYVSIDSKYKDDVIKTLTELKYKCEFNESGGVSGKNLKINWSS